MFNLSTTGNVAYNGISQLSENQSSFSDGTESTSRTKLRAYMNSDGENKFRCGSRTPSDGNNISLVSKLKLTSPKDDVYTFNDSDQTFVTNKIAESHPKGSLTYNKTEGLFAKKNITGGLITSPKKVQIVKPGNGYTVCRDNGSDDLRNGICKAPAFQENSARSFNNKSSSPHRIAVKQNKDLFAPLLFSKDVKLETNIISSKLHNNGLNNFTKNSITNSNIKPVIVKSNTLYQNKKPMDVVVKQESGKFGIGSEGYTSSYSNYLNKTNSKILAKKLPSGKPPPRFNKVRRGRGPALHESLQRITPSPVKVFNHKTSIANENYWHSPGSEIFDCGVLDSYQSNNPFNDSDPSDDDTFDDVEDWLLESDSDAGDKKEKSAITRASLRRQITQLKQLEVISNSSKSSSALYNAVKMQIKQHRKNNYNECYRVRGSALNILIAANGTNGILSAGDKRNLKHGGQFMESPACAHAGCEAPSLSGAGFCHSHISHSPETRLFSECTAKFSDNTQCRIPVADSTDDSPLCAEHSWKKDNFRNIIQNNKPNRSSRKRPKPPTIIESPPRNLNEPQNMAVVNEINNIQENSHFDRFTNDPHFFTPEDIGHTVGASLFHQNNNTELNVCSNSSAYESSEDTGIGGLSDSELIASVSHPPHIDPDVVAEVFAMHETEDLPTLDLPAPGPPQEPNIDLSIVFNDFFAEQNGEYIPSREETEELERALEAVNQDVKSLEKLAGSQHPSLLLDNLLDERVFAETLASLPDVFSNIPAAKISSGSPVDATQSPS